MNFRTVIVVVIAFGVSGLGCGLRENAVVPGGDSGVATAGTGGSGGRGASGTGGGTSTTTLVMLGSGGGGATPPLPDAGMDAPVVLDAPMDQGNATDTATGGSAGALGLGVACLTKSDCASGACVDGVCCDTVCVDSCSQCNLKNFEGRCTAVPAGVTAPAPHPACVKAAAATCKQTGLCDGKGVCAMYASGESGVDPI